MQDTAEPSAFKQLQAHLSAARVALNASEFDRALQQVDLALAIDPAYLAARALRERIEQQKIAPLRLPPQSAGAPSMEPPEAAAWQPTDCADPPSPRFPESSGVSADGFALFEERARRRRVERRLEAARQAIDEGQLGRARAAIAEVCELAPERADVEDLSLALAGAERAAAAMPARGPWLAAACVFGAILLAASWVEYDSLGGRPASQTAALDSTDVNTANGQPGARVDSEPAALASTPLDGAVAVPSVATAPGQADAPAPTAPASSPVTSASSAVTPASAAPGTTPAAPVVTPATPAVTASAPPGAASQSAAGSSSAAPPSASATSSVSIASPPEPSSSASTTAPRAPNPAVQPQSQGSDVMPSQLPSPAAAPTATPPAAPPPATAAPAASTADAPARPPADRVPAAPPVARVDAAPATSVDPRAVATAYAPTDERLVRDTLQRYRVAYEGLNAKSAHAVWPGVDEPALARAFEGLLSQTLTFDDCAVDLNGVIATATCRGSARYTPKDGNREPRSESRVWNFTLHKTSDQWQIDSARVSR